jgi:hypothetical protein
MVTVADYTTGTRDRMYQIYVDYLTLLRKVADMTDEVTALGGAAGIYGAAGVDFPEQADGFDYADMVAAFAAVTSLIGAPTAAQKAAVIKARRS